MLAKGGEETSLAFGGQALIEGVMIRSRSSVVMCVRQPNNEIITHSEELDLMSQRHSIFKLPLLRGIIALLETLYLGVKGVFFSANAAVGNGDEFTAKELAIVAIMVLAMVSFFFVVPFILTSFLNLQGFSFAIVEAAVRLSIFLAYLAAVATWKEFNRILQYHGAEHKAINAHEGGAVMDVTNVKKYSRLHPRCGTSFIFIVLIVSILLFSIMPDLGFAARLAYRLLLIPVIGSISYELLKFSGRHQGSVLIRILTLPGLAFQRFTTREPDDDIIEVAIRAVEEAIGADSFTAG